VLSFIVKFLIGGVPVTPGKIYEVPRGTAGDLVAREKAVLAP
jgi:hypothetical protein